MPDNSVLALSYHQQLLQLKKSMGSMLFSLAEILKRIKDSELYIPLGYESFVEYVSCPEVGLNVRTAYYYIEIYETYIDRLKYTPEQLVGYSYDKLRKLMPVVKESKNVKEVMDNALTLRWHDFSKQYKDGKENEGFKDYLPAPEFYRCDCHGKWFISVPLEDLCPKFLEELQKRFDKVVK